jgi:SAM-dependent methyltransferase
MALTVRSLAAAFPTVARFARQMRAALRWPPSSAGERVAALWGENAGTWQLGGALHWTELPQVRRRINTRVSGDPDVDPWLHAIRTYLAGRLPLERALTLGCGDGLLERGLTQYGFCRRHDAFDLAPGAIDKARRAAAEAGLSHVRYEVRDGNTVTLEAGSYDCVLAVHAVHHLEALEHVFGEVRAALRPGGLFVLDEFVGPTRFQWTDRQLEVVNGLLRALPPQLRRSCRDGRTPKPAVERPTLAEMRRIDPSEAARSAEILPLLPRYFEVLEVKGYGGTILHLLLHEIAGNFYDPDAARLLDAICDIEDGLIAAGDLQSDFAVIIARRA